MEEKVNVEDNYSLMSLRWPFILEPHTCLCNLVLFIIELGRADISMIVHLFGREAGYLVFSSIH